LLHSIKVWDAGAFFGPKLPLCGLISPRVPSLVATLELKGAKLDAHGMDIKSVAFSPDGKMIVSRCEYRIKVWDSSLLQPYLGVCVGILVCASLLQPTDFRVRKMARISSARPSLPLKRSDMAVPARPYLPPPSDRLVRRR
jgi:WD40 repeat protein